MVDGEKYHGLLGEISEMKEELMGIKEVKTGLAKQLQAITTKEQVNEGRIKDLSEQVRELGLRLKQAEQEKDVLEVELKSVRNMLQEKEEVLRDVARDKQEEERKLKKVQAEIDRLQGDNQRLHRELNGLEAEIQSQKQRWDRDKEYIKYLEDEKEERKMRDLQKYEPPKDFELTGNKTADFYMQDKENTSLNTIRNIPNAFYEDEEETISYGKITKNRSKNRSVQRS